MNKRRMTYKIEIAPQGHSTRVIARLDDRVLHPSTKQPLLDCARILLSEGADPNASIWTVRPNGVVCLVSTIGVAADTAIAEHENGPPIFTKYRPFEDVRKVFPRESLPRKRL